MVVIKIGSGLVLTNECDFDWTRLRRISEEVAPLWKHGRNVLLVASGAVVCGAGTMGTLDPLSRRVASTHGWIRLCGALEHIFEQHSISLAPVLLRANTRGGVAYRSAVRSLLIPSPANSFSNARPSLILSPWQDTLLSQRMTRSDNYKRP